MSDELPTLLRDSHRLHSRAGVRVLLRRDWEQALPLEALLAGAPLEAWGRPVPHALRGRGAMHVLATARGEIVAKELRRGGLLGGLLRRSFLDPARPLREAAVAEALLARGVATAPVVAARATRVGPFWRLEIATARLPAEGDLLAVLRARGPDARLAAATGRALRLAHDAGLRHRDLQVKNILVPPGGGAPAVLDLDRCAMGDSLGVPERLASLVRFARSLAKHELLGPGTGRAARAFTRAYGDLPGLRAGALLRRLLRETERSVRRHRSLWR